ncbi:hypothetical protein ACQ4PT_051419 [Festuca glaucescens]
MVALSGAHTIGAARCASFRSRIYNDTNINAGFATRRRQVCGPAERRHRRQPGPAGRLQLRALRQRLLPQPAQPLRPAALGPGALRQRRARRLHRADVRGQRRRLLRRLRHRHDQDGQHQPAHGVQRRDPQQLQETQLTLFLEIRGRGSVDIIAS